MVSWLVPSPSDLGSSPIGDIVLCYWQRHLTPTITLFSLVYKWVPANLLLGVTLQSASILTCSLTLHATKTADKSRLDKSLDSFADLLYHFTFNFRPFRTLLSVRHTLIL